MAKKKNVPESTATPAPLLSKRSWKIVGAGIATVVVGFVVLSFTDPQGQNTASRLSPFLIIGGYALIAAGLFQKTH